MSMDVMTAAFNVGHDYNGGAAKLAEDIGKNPNSFNAELAGTGTAKLGLRDALKMTLRTRDYRILDAFNLACGRNSVPLPDVEGLETEDCLAALAKASREFSELCAEVLNSLGDDGKINDNERNRIQREGGQALATINLVMRAVDVRAEASKPALQRVA